MYICPLLHKLLHKYVGTHSYSILTHMYVHIHSGIPTHRQKYICTCTERAEISSPSLTSVLCTKPGVHILSKWHRKFAFALYSCQSPTSPLGKSFLLSIECAQEAVPTPYIHNSFILKGKMKRKYQGQSSSCQYLWVCSTAPRLQNSYWNWAQGRSSKKITPGP